MSNLDLTKYGITGATVIAHNPSYEQLFEEETKADRTRCSQRDDRYLHRSFA